MPQDIASLTELWRGQGRMLIVVHDNPDPDALGSACALALLARATGNARSRICCEGFIGRAENRTLARELRLKLLPAARVNWKNWPVIALVDAQPSSGNNSFPSRMVPQIIIDHHPELKLSRRARYVDIRPHYGSCASILVEYLTAAGVAIPPDLAAALCYSISTDTQDLVRAATPADVQAYVQLYPLADKRALGRILHPRLHHDYYSIVARAILSSFTYANIIGAHLGEIQHPDSVSLVADLLLRHERMAWSFVTGVWKGELCISLRGLHGRGHAGTTLRGVLGKRGRGGGHGTMAGGKIPLNSMTVEQREQLEKELVLTLIRHLRRREDVTLRPLIGPMELNEAFFKFV